MNKTEMNKEIKKMQKAKVLIIGNKKYIEMDMALKFTEQAIKESHQVHKILKYPTKRQIWFIKHENLLIAILGVVIAFFCVVSYAYFNGGLR